MITHDDLIQGTPAWEAFRAAHFNASDAPAMLGASPYKSRNELLRERATGISVEVDAATQRRFDDGHRFEALARPLAEEIVGTELYPVVGSEGKLAASFDGLTMLEDIAFEHKSVNDDIRACKSAADLPLHYRIQMQQQLMVSGAAKCLFMATKWDGNDSLVGEPVSFWYDSDPALAQRILDGWAEFERDVLAYEHHDAQPQAIGRAPEYLPALNIEVTGMVTRSNLVEFRGHALAVFDGIKTDLQTDQDFADADKTTKWCKEVEDRLEAAKQHALSQTTTIDELFRTIDAIKDEARQKRLALEKLVKARKESIRVEKVEVARRQFAAHVAVLQREVVGVLLVAPQPDFGGAIKGLKTLASVDNALGVAMANARIAADKLALDVREKMAWIAANAADYRSLLPDLQQLIAKPMDDFALTITSRIDRHKQAEAEKLERERERIRQEEAAKLAAQQAEAAAARAERTADAAAQSPPQQPAAAPALADAQRRVVPIPAIAQPHQDDDIGAFLRVHGREFNAPADTLRAVLGAFVAFQMRQRDGSASAA